ncbi:MFS transporter [Dasania sp. GY-MA-18]|uniref:MFS transporter n=1 Tax=Dasania phycosphaerae TaxID=2950436 RepID=A0A9J6RPU2_9GAMM|nr:MULTISPECIES: MFS transporter [Dasania]MCR8924161.1 MFS transporter [Dasania sp. GY-MA-18]MCZ0866734.1 MFS transporter [Dasania phycosphaerae]MCZ0870319.1 MFS transporter [Dasania phycosphaerae]
MSNTQALRNLIIPIYLPSIFLAIGSGAALFIIPLISLELGATISSAGLIFSLRGLGMLISGIPIGLLIAKLGSKTAMLLGTALICIAAIIASQAQQQSGIALASLLMGAGSGCWILARIHFVSLATSISHRGRAMATMMAIERVGWLIGPLLAGLIIKFFDHHKAFLLVAGMGFISLLLIALTKHTQRGNEVDDSQFKRLSTWRLLFNYKDIFIGAGSVVIVLQLLRSARSFIIPIWGVAIGIDELAIASVTFFCSLADLAMFYPAGWLLDKKSRKAAAIPCLAIFSCSFLLLPLATSYSYFLWIAILSGLGNGLGTGFIMTLGADFAPQRQKAQFLGLWRTIGDGGNLSGPVIIGALAEALSLSSATLVVGSLGLAGLLILIYKVPEPIKKSLS